MPNGMQKLTLMRHLLMQMQRVLIVDGELKTDSNIGSNGDGSSLEVPRTLDLWESRPVLYHHWAMESLFTHVTQIWTTLLTLTIDWTLIID